ncbi:MAG: chemotaxis protein CheW [Proteobacteria bacterium]|nr:chemotaxis protein CheW [Pseudomonadota bacterium]
MGFYVGEVHYAIEIACVSEIIRPMGVVRLPQASQEILGVVDHRGHVVPIVDLRRRFGMSSPDELQRAHWIVVKVREGLVGLAVDSVSEVFAANDPGERRAPDLGPSEAARSIDWVYKHRDRLTFVLDVDRTTAPADALDLDEARNLLAEPA